MRVSILSFLFYFILIFFLFLFIYFLAVTLLNEASMRQKQQNGQRVLETSLKNKKDGGRNAEKFFWLEDFFWKFSDEFY